MFEPIFLSLQIWMYYAIYNNIIARNVEGENIPRDMKLEAECLRRRE